jgi:hypothetical protein
MATVQTFDGAKRRKIAHAHAIKRLGLVSENLGLLSLPLFSTEHG